MKYKIELEYSGDPITGWTATVHFPSGGTATVGRVTPNMLPYLVLNSAGDLIRHDMEHRENGDD